MRVGVRGGVERLMFRWCGIMHQDITWPCRGLYSCRVCGRIYPVPWESGRLRSRATRPGPSESNAGAASSVKVALR